MYIKDNVISFFEYGLNKQRIKDDEIENMRYALFMQQHVDDDTFTNENEFEFDHKNREVNDDNPQTPE